MKIHLSEILYDMVKDYLMRKGSLPMLLFYCYDNMFYFMRLFNFFSKEVFWEKNPL